MTLKLTPREAVVVMGGREPRPADAEALAHLMFDAYRGTIDDEGETLEGARREVEKVLGGVYGVFDHACSHVVERDGRLVGATLITRLNGLPFLAFSMTAPAWKRRGLARAGLDCVIEKLYSSGETSLGLVVTEGNLPAETLYAQIGFTRLVM